MKLFRGISIPSDMVYDIIDGIKQNGMKVGNGQQSIMVADLREEYEDPVKWKNLVLKDSLNINETREKTVETICACGDKDSSLYYACKHNRTENNAIPILIEFESPIQNIWIDGRDFLFPVIQFWDRKKEKTQHKTKINKGLIEVFGEDISKYLDQSVETKDMDRRIALVDLMINDQKVVAGHFNNITWLQGRYGTFFKSAFSVRSPIQHSQIINVQITNDQFIEPRVFLDFRELMS